eukprot:NODE_143_length_15882_cov_1.296585.p5 type:complete len:348 gc:universal NODE_143_length_15882_cov_1.296585:6898-7941(+)
MILIVLCSLFAIRHCVVGAGIAGTTAAGQLRIAFPSHDINLIDFNFDDSSLDAFKDELSQFTISDFEKYALLMGFSEETINIWRNSLFPSEILENHQLKIGKFIYLMNLVRGHLIENNNVVKIQNRVAFIKILRKEPRYILYSKNEEEHEKLIAKCNHVYMALGGTPKQSLELHGNPTQFGISKSLDFLKGSNARTVLEDKNVFVVGGGYTENLVTQKLIDIGIKFVLVKTFFQNDRHWNTEKLCDFSSLSRYPAFKPDDYVFYAHELQPNMLPTIYTGKTKLSINVRKMTGQRYSYKYFKKQLPFKTFVIYALGAMVRKGNIFNFIEASKQIINKIQRRHNYNEAQ